MGDWIDEGSAEPSGIDQSTLSDREREVLEVAVTGASAAAIAEELSLTEATVRSHLAHIYAKLGVAGRVELLARMKGVAPRDPTPGSGTRELEPSGRGRARPGIGLLAAAMVAIGLGAFVVVRPDLPPSTSLDSVSRLVGERQVTALDLRGDTLFVTTTDGRRFRVDGASAQAVDPLQMAASAEGVEVSSGGDTLAATLLIVATGVLPAALVVLAAALVLRWHRRPPAATRGSANA